MKIKMNMQEILKAMVEQEASDLHLCVGLSPIFRLCGELKTVGGDGLTNDDIRQMLLSILPKERQVLTAGGAMDLSIEVDKLARFRINIYYDMNGLCAAFRLVPTKIKRLRELGLPDVVDSVVKMERGLVLVTGITGSGKSTTVASLIDKINHERQAHIITIEDPIEFVHSHRKCVINQMEVGTHTPSFSEALRSALREDPDIIFVGEIRDLETISMAITAAETGHLVLATLHTRGAAQSIDRIVDVFPSYQQEQIRVQLADTLEMSIAQVLIPSKDKKTRHLATEIMVATSAIRHNIRDQKTFQIPTVIETGFSVGMQTLDKSLKNLVESGKVSTEDVLPWVNDKSVFEKK